MNIPQEDLIDEDRWLTALVHRLEPLDVPNRRRVFAACVGVLDAVFHDDSDPKTQALAGVVARMLDGFWAGNGPSTSGLDEELRGAWVRHSISPSQLGLPAGYWRARDRVAQVLLRQCGRPASEFSDEQCAVEIAQCFDAVAFVFAPPQSLPEAMQMNTPETDADGGIQFFLRQYSVIFAHMAGRQEFGAMRAAAEQVANSLRTVLPRVGE